MDPSDKAVRRVQAVRVSTSAGALYAAEETVGVAVEAPLTIDVEDVGSFTVLCVPQDRRAMALGFLLTEGVIEHASDVVELRPCRDDPGIVRVKLAGKPPSIDDPDRSLLISSSCGACGVENLDARLASLPEVGDTLSIASGLLRSAGRSLFERQTLFGSCGGTHAAGIFTDRGEIVSIAEDVGRHSALDKAIGKCMLDGRSTAGCGVELSGRTSLEMVGKCARAGIELISSISAPTSLAIEVAERCNITLCAFVRESRATVFAHPGRLIGYPS